MASDSSFVDFVCEQVSDAGDVTARKMFGEYAIYCDGKVVGLVCDNQFFVKPTASGRALLAAVAEAPPYPGAKPYFLIGDQLEDRAFVTELIRQTALELPAPKPKKPKAKKFKPERA
ncbi:TfoX/Sxy family protein [Nodosilinea nodulosa]|uniref:TfoX/Sxy family protein n=1 Tax=Nodosilinea nodulosa TaxID=416001 RepID=UPI0003097830|nr:TfoX/Sxy family protein [Nodosilinea nodulosa]